MHILGFGGEQLSEQAVSGGTTTWSHTNVFAGGALLATYSGSDTYFNLTDWQGTKRAENSAGGCLTGWLSLPYGDNTSGGIAQSDPTTVAIGSAPQCGVDATEHHFTGKEHDEESGNDDFGARYYADTTGRWLSPDWAAAAEAVPYATFDNPQSLNLYSFVGNNPLDREDADGHCNSATADNESDKCGDAQRADSTSDTHNAAAGEKSGQDHRPRSIIQRVKLAAAHHPTATKAIVGSIVIGTAISGLFDGGTSEALVPEEVVLGEGLEAADAGAGTVIEGAEAGDAAAEGASAETGPDAGAGLRKQIELHKQKLSDYMRDPEAYDNKGFLKNASPELREKIIQARAKNLQHQIDNFTKQLEKLNGGEQN